MEGEGPKRLQLSATGPATVTAGDIMVSGDIKVMNPALVICHLDDGATLNMELVAHRQGLCSRHRQPTGRRPARPDPGRPGIGRGPGGGRECKVRENVGGDVS